VTLIGLNYMNGKVSICTINNRKVYIFGK